MRLEDMNESQRPPRYDRLLAYCAAKYRDGLADEVSGDAEAPTGLFYRVGHCLVVIGGSGGRTMAECEDEREARTLFDDLHAEYVAWRTIEDDAADYAAQPDDA